MTWTIHNDLLSVTVGINARLRLCRMEGVKPTLIRMGPRHSILFWRERWIPYIPVGPLEVPSGDVFWDEKNRCWCWKLRKRLIPMRFNDRKIYGIAIEGLPEQKPP